VTFCRYHLKGGKINQTEVRIPSNGLQLVGMVYLPEGQGPFPAVVVCHPHPQYGGSMDNNVVDSLCDALGAGLCVSLKFNFRGVGGSEGTFENGIGEQDDVRAAISFLGSQKGVDPDRIGLAGYSAGAAWGLSSAYNDKRVKALAAVSPPLPMFDFKFLRDCLMPIFLISGGEDSLIPEDDFSAFCRDLPGPKEYLVVPGADHIWWGYEKTLAGKVADFFQRSLGHSPELINI
jgi:uncharacterized protein